MILKSVKLSPKSWYQLNLKVWKFLVICYDLVNWDNNTTRLLQSVIYCNYRFVYMSTTGIMYRSSPYPLNCKCEIFILFLFFLTSVVFVVSFLIKSKVPLLVIYRVIDKYKHTCMYSIIIIYLSFHHMTPWSGCCGDRMS